MFTYFKKKKSEKKFTNYLDNVAFTYPNVFEYKTIQRLNTLKNTPHLLKMPELCDAKIFCAKLNKIEVQYSESGEATKLVGSLNFDQFVRTVMPKDNGKYVFHNILKDRRACNIIPQLIRIPKFIKKNNMRDLRISRLYAGGKYSGTHLHIHSEALNYLVSGKKLWVMFPFSSKNNDFVDSNNMRYGQVKSTALQWFMDSYRLMTAPNAIENLNIFIQEEKEVVYVPLGCHHAVVNLEDSIGITYSWVN